MIQIILKVGKENILMINTDGFMTTIPIDDLEYGLEMGQWKQHKGTCQVVNSMCVRWLCPKCKNYGKKKCNC